MTGSERGFGLGNVARQRAARTRFRSPPRLFRFQDRALGAVLRVLYGDGTVAVAGLEYELSVVFASTAVTT
jgi:hypothetical protein